MILFQNKLSFKNIIFKEKKNGKNVEFKIKFGKFMLNNFVYSVQNIDI